jgi:hypothetical protein
MMCSKLYFCTFKIENTFLCNESTEIKRIFIKNLIIPACGSVAVKALCNKPEGLGFDTR